MSAKGAQDRAVVYATRAHDVLRHLDALKPVLQLDFNYVKLVYERLTKSKPTHILLNYYDVLVADVLKVFPNQATIMQNLVVIYQFHKPHVGMSIMVLDVLTILCVLTTGSVTEKSKLLFTMYNINQTGLMDEMEHVNFILRITDCMRKLKLMSILDITAQDAKFIALEARVKHENNQITFVPGLYVADFTRWVQTSKECQTLFRFTKVLSRLVDSLHALENRTNALLSVMETKNEYKPNAWFVPPLDMFKECQPTRAAVFVVFRRQTQVSLSLPLVNLLESEIFIKLDKIIPCVHNRYEIPRSILKRNIAVWKANKAPELECCRKGVLLTSYRSQYVNSTQRQSDHVPFERVDISNLDAGSVYYITIYTSTVQYRTVKVHTLTAPAAALAVTAAKYRELNSDAMEDASTENKTEESEGDEEEDIDAEDNSHSSDSVASNKQAAPAENSTGPRRPHSLTILPACLSAQEAEAACKQLPLPEASTVVFTGTVCSILQGLKESVALLTHKEATMEFATRLAGLLGATASAEYATHWERCLGIIAGIAQCTSPLHHVHDLVTAVEARQVVYYDGGGPWEHPEFTGCLREVLGEACFNRVHQHVERLYGRYVHTISSPTHVISDAYTQCFFVRKDAPSSSVSTITLSALTELLFQQIKQQDDLRAAPKHLILLVRNPLDLLGDMEPIAAEEADKAGRSADAAATLRAASKSNLLRKSGLLVPTTGQPAPKLTGRHELLHGEYSSSTAAMATAVEDQYSYFLSTLQEETTSVSEAAIHNPADVSHVFNTFLRVASKWLQGGQRSTDFDLDWKTTESERKLTIVSCNWDNGENFEIKFDPSGVFIRHENLLPTRSYVPPVSEDNEPVWNYDPTSSAVSSPSRPFSRGDSTHFTGSNSASSFAPLISARSPSKFSSSFQNLNEEVNNSRLPSRVTSRRKLDTPIEVPAPAPVVKSAYEMSAALALSLQTTEDAMRRFAASLPRAAMLQMAAATPLRAVHCPAANDGGAVEDRLCEFTPIKQNVPEADRWWRTLLLVPEEEREAASSVNVDHGPHIVRVTDTSGTVSVGVAGNGRISCTLYEVPVHIQYHDIVSVVSTAERAKLRTIAMQSQYCTGVRELVFSFENLTPFCCYCVVFDPFKDTPAVGYFRTLGLPNSKVDTIMVCPMSAEDVRSPSVRLGRMAHLSAISRNPASAMFCLDYNAAVLRNEVGEHLPHGSDLNYLRKASNLRLAAVENDNNLHSGLPFMIHHSPAQQTHQDAGSVYVSTHGHYCYISLKNENSASIRKAIQAVMALRLEPNVRFLILLVNQPLVRFLRLRTDGQFVCDGPINKHRSLCCLLMLCLLDWKRLDDSNDCKIICTAPVSLPKCVMIRHAVPETSQFTTPFQGISPLSPSAPVVGTNEALGSAEEKAVDHNDGDGDSIPLVSPVHQNNLQLETLLELVNDPSLKDGQLQTQVAEKLAHLVGHAHQQGRSFLCTPGTLSIEHLILPIDHHAVENEEVDESITLPDGACQIEGLIEYEVLHEFTPEETGVHQIPPRLELYKDAITAEEKIQPVVYQLEFFIRCFKAKPENEDSKFALNAAPAVHLLHADGVSASVSSDVNALHRVYVRPLINEFDLLELVLGPVFGSVSEQSILALFEFNMNLRQLSCVLQPLGAQDENEFVYRTIENIKAYELLEIEFVDLLSGTTYEVFLPEMFGTKSIGKFKTVEPFVAFAQIAISGSNTLKNHPILPTIVEQLGYQQSVNLAQVRLLNEMIAEDEKMFRNAPTYALESGGGYDNTWAKLGAHLATPGVHTAAVFHIGGISALSHYWKRLLGAMIMHARRLEIPLREASTVGQWYFKQIEQVVKDTFRLFWSTPVVQEVLSHTSNIPVYQAQYLLPLSVLDDQIEAARIVSSEEDAMLLQLVRRVFESHLQAYLSRLYGFEIGASHHFISWRSNSLVTIGLDNVSGRRKIKKKGETEEGEGDDEVPTEAAAGAGKSSKTPKAPEKVDAKDPFSLGFIDRAQWKNVRALVLDKTITHVVILTEQPILSLAHLTREFTPPESIPKGEVLQWAPTAQDLEIFLKFWFDWLAMFQSGEVSSCRSVLLVSACKVPYSTLIQDLKTGLKIHQMCVGEYDDGKTAPVLPLRLKDISMTGKLGTIRYVHQLDGQDYLMTQSTGVERNSNFIERGATATTTVPTGSGPDNAQQPLVLARSAGFATLRLWFDSWKALGIWAQEAPDAELSGTHLRDATLLVGPMLGAPVLHASSSSTSESIFPLQTDKKSSKNQPAAHFTIAMLIEVDRPTTVVLVATSLFSDHVLRMEMSHLVPLRPHVLNIGPLEPEGRYNVRLVSGLKPSPYNSFVIDTYVHENETNIMALNCAPVIGEVAGSQIIIEAAQRCSVPFCGITAVLHTNFQPNFDRVINEFRYSNSLLEELKEARRVEQLTPAFRTHLENIIEVFRDQFRTVLSKPSYAELLRNGYNLMMQNAAAGFADNVEADAGSDLYQISSLVVLIIARLNQEYFDRWMTPEVNVFRATKIAKSTEPTMVRQTIVIDPPFDVPPGDKRPPTPKSRPASAKQPVDRVVEWSDPADTAVDSVFKQWLANCTPTPSSWSTWVSPNGKTSIEQVLSVNEDNFAAIEQQLRDAPIENGTRIMVINENPSHDDAADALFLGESDIGVRFQNLLQKWKCKQEDRDVCVICPSRKYGTQKIDVKLTPIEPPPPVEEPPPAPVAEPLAEGAEEVVPPVPEVFEIVFKYVYTLDTVYRSNEFKRLQAQSEMDKALQEKNKKDKKKNSAAAAKSKRAQKAREEEERLRKEEVAREVAEIKAKQIPDGYLMIGCCTTRINTPEFSATVTNAPRVSVIGDFIGTPEEREEMFDDLVDGLPTPYDFIQLPEWFRKFSPSLEGMFVRDEVYLLMRQNPESRKALDLLEAGDFIPQLIALYEKSRLSELSRPEDLREIDMNIAGVMSMFFRDLVKKMWDQAVPAEVKPHMFNISDEFVMSYCFARALPDPATAMSSGLEFARAVQYALMLSVTLRSAQIMSKLDRYAYVIKSPDLATLKVKTMESKEAAIVEEKFAAENRRSAADKAWRLADPAAALERDRIAAEAAAEAAALEAAINAASKKVITAAEVAEKEAQALAAIQADVEKALSVVDVNYDSDLDAINNDEADYQKRQAIAMRTEQIKQRDIDATLLSVKQFTTARSEKIKATQSTKEIAEQEEEEALGFDLERDGMERLEQLRSQWLVAAVEVVMEVIVEKEIVVAVQQASGQLLDECYEEALNTKLGTTEESRLSHAKLQVQRLRSETAKARRVYGKRMSFMS